MDPSGLMLNIESFKEEKRRVKKRNGNKIENENGSGNRSGKHKRK